VSEREALRVEWDALKQRAIARGETVAAPYEFVERVLAMLDRDAICAHPFDSMVCVAPAGHDGPHLTSNERFPHGAPRGTGEHA